MKGDGSSRRQSIAKPGYKRRGKATVGGCDKKAARKYDDRK